MGGGRQNDDIASHVRTECARTEACCSISDSQCSENQFLRPIDSLCPLISATTQLRCTAKPTRQYCPVCYHSQQAHIGQPTGSSSVWSAPRRRRSARECMIWCQLVISGTINPVDLKVQVRCAAVREVRELNRNLLLYWMNFSFTVLDDSYCVGYTLLLLVNITMLLKLYTVG